MDNILFFAILMGLILYYSETSHKRGLRGGTVEIAIGICVVLTAAISGAAAFFLTKDKCSGNVISSDYTCTNGTLKSNSDDIKGASDTLCCNPPPVVCTCPNGTATVSDGTGGTLCEADGNVDCSACDTGYTISAPAGTGLQTCANNSGASEDQTGAVCTYTVTGKIGNAVAVNGEYFDTSDTFQGKPVYKNANNIYMTYDGTLYNFVTDAQYNLNRVHENTNPRARLAYTHYPDDGTIGPDVFGWGDTGTGTITAC